MRVRCDAFENSPSRICLRGLQKMNIIIIKKNCKYKKRRPFLSSFYSFYLCLSYRHNLQRALIHNGHFSLTLLSSRQRHRILYIYYYYTVVAASRAVNVIQSDCAGYPYAYYYYVIICVRAYYVRSPYGVCHIPDKQKYGENFNL